MVKNVKIGCHTFTVSEVECVNKFTPRKGEINFYDRAIRIDSGMTTSDKFETLIHEVLHGISEFFQAELTEEQTQRMGAGLAMVLVDNPEIMAELGGG